MCELPAELWVHPRSGNRNERYYRLRGIDILFTMLGLSFGVVVDALAGELIEFEVVDGNSGARL